MVNGCYLGRPGIQLRDPYRLRPATERNRQSVESCPFSAHAIAETIRIHLIATGNVRTS